MNNEKVRYVLILIIGLFIGWLLHGWLNPCTPCVTVKPAEVEVEIADKAVNDVEEAATSIAEKDKRIEALLAENTQYRNEANTARSEASKLAKQLADEASDECKPVIQEVVRYTKASCPGNSYSERDADLINRASDEAIIK